MPVNFFDPSEAFNASTAGDVLMVSASRSRKHQWLRGKLGDLYPQVPSNFELGDFIDPVGGGVSERRRAVLNKDTGRPVAAVTERYELIPHRKIMDPLMDLRIDGVLGSDLPAELYVGDEGERFGFRVLMPNLRVEIPGEQDLIGRIEGFNSVDGSMPYRMAIGLYRWVCGNGNSIGIGESNVIRLHTSQLGGGGHNSFDLSKFIGDSAGRMPETKRRFENWTKQKVTPEEWVGAEMEIEGAFDRSRAKRILSIWETGNDPSISTTSKVVPGMPQGRTRWRLYQAMTWAASRTKDLQTQTRLHRATEHVMAEVFKN